MIRLHSLHTSGLLLLLTLLLIGCRVSDTPAYAEGPIQLPPVIDGGMAYQANPFTRTVEDVQLFKNEAPCILITHASENSPVMKWRTQTLLIAKAGPGEVSYDAITIYRYGENHAESGGHFYAEYFWAADVNGDAVDDLLILGWSWGGPGWFGGDLATAPERALVGLRAIIREATDRGHPLGISSDQFYASGKLAESGVTADQIRLARERCNEPIWRERLRHVEIQLCLEAFNQ